MSMRRRMNTYQAVLHVLITYNGVRMSQAQIAALAACSEGSVKRALKRLALQGLIKYPRYRRGRGCIHTYQIAPEAALIDRYGRFSELQ